MPRCLESAVGLVHEIIVVDTGSQDGTPDIASRFNARVLHCRWCDDFATARNEALRHASGDWIFWLDADEFLDESNRRNLANLFAGLADENAAYILKQRSVSPLPGDPPVDVDQVRVFRNLPDIRWEYRVHEQILPAVRRAGHEIRWTNIVIQHTGYQSAEVRRRKLERNLHLLHLDHAQRPQDPFILFNLGWAYLDLGRPADGLPFLRRSLELSQPNDSIVGKLYSLLAHAYDSLRQPAEALVACRDGLARFPDDAELLFRHGRLLAALGDHRAAEAAWLRLITPAENGPPACYFTGTSAGLRGCATRQQLALLYQRQGRAADAEEQWRAALAEQPDYGPARLGLAELLLEQQRWPELDEALEELRRRPHLTGAAATLQARAHLARGAFAAARQLLEAEIARQPEALPPRVLLTHALLGEGRDPAAAERALRDVLARAPGEAESWRNLAVLLRRQGRVAEAADVCRDGRLACPDDPGLLLLHGLLLQETGDLPFAEATLLQLLQATPPLPADDAARPRARTARQHLAEIYLAQRRHADAEAQWRGVLAERPGDAAAWLGLAEVCLAQGRWAELEEAAARLEADPRAAAAAPLLRARGLLARRQFADARRLLEGRIAAEPRAVPPRVLLSHALLQEGRDPAAAAGALRDVLALDPANAEARHNLEVLLRQHGNVA